MKVLIFLLVVSLTSASAAQPFNNDAESVTKYLDGINAIINQIIQTMQAAIQQVQRQTAEWIQQERENIEKAYKEAIAEYENYVAEVAHDFQQAITNEIRPCFNGLREKLDIVRNQTREGISKCRAEGHEKYEKLKPEIIAYCNSSRELIEVHENLSKIVSTMKVLAKQLNAESRQPEMSAQQSIQSKKIIESF